jgi:hypothetical protein
VRTQAILSPVVSKIGFISPTDKFFRVAIERDVCVAVNAGNIARIEGDREIESADDVRSH